MSKHTQGPLVVRMTGTCSAAWAEIGQEIDGCFYELASTGTTHVERTTKRGRPIAGTPGDINEKPQRFEQTTDCQEFMANAQLWSTAWELLDALQDLVALLPDPELDQDDVQRGFVEKARAVIAKATGEQA